MYTSLLLWCIVFMESGMSPLAMLWASASLALTRQAFTPLQIWLCAGATYLLNGAFLETFPGRVLQPHEAPLSLRRICPMVLLNFFSTLALTLVAPPAGGGASHGEVCLYLLAAGLGNELIYAPLHKLLHTRVLYKFHHRHHLQRAPRALGAIYCSFFEMWFANLPSFLVPLYLMHAPSSAYLVWTIAGIQTTQLHHSGKRFFWCAGGQPAFHDEHHRCVTKNFGNLGFLERGMGTWVGEKNV